MTPDQAIALLPFMMLAGTAVAVMVGIAFVRRRRLTLSLTLAGLAASFALLFVSARVAPRPVTPLLVIDPFALFYSGLMIAASIAVALLADGYLQRRGGWGEEFYVLLLLATLGSTVLVASGHFASFFLGLELLSVSLYGLIGFTRRQQLATEAALKYLILAGVSSAFLLFGMALAYAQLGTLQFSEIVAQADGSGYYPILGLTGFGLMLVGIGFKLALVPFHLWTPDVYQGAPAPVTAFVATVSKGAMFALLQRFFTPLEFRHNHPLWVIFTVLAVASMLCGSLLALRQHNVKRLLAYSSIAHLGYLMVAFLASSAAGLTAAAFYLAAYFVTTLGAFGVVTALSTQDHDADTLDDYAGLAWRQPFLATVFTAMLLSLAGIPLTMGFIGKFYVLAAAAGVGLWWLLIVLVVTSAIGLVYYLRVVFALYRRPDPLSKAAVPLPWTGALVLGMLLFLLIGLGLYPTPLIGWVQAALTGP